jgi:hypothetical protein
VLLVTEIKEDVVDDSLLKGRQDAEKSVLKDMK